MKNPCCCCYDEGYGDGHADGVDETVKQSIALSAPEADALVRAAEYVLKMPPFLEGALRVLDNVDQVDCLTNALARLRATNPKEGVTLT